MKHTAFSPRQLLAIVLKILFSGLGDTWTLAIAENRQKGAFFKRNFKLLSGKYVWIAGSTNGTANRKMKWDEYRPDDTGITTVECFVSEKYLCLKHL